MARVGNTYDEVTFIVANIVKLLHAPFTGERKPVKKQGKKKSPRNKADGHFQVLANDLMDEDDVDMDGGVAGGTQIDVEDAWRDLPKTSWMLDDAPDFVNLLYTALVNLIIRMPDKDAQWMTTAHILAKLLPLMLSTVQEVAPKHLLKSLHGAARKAVLEFLGKLVVAVPSLRSDRAKAMEVKVDVNENQVIEVSDEEGEDEENAKDGAEEKNGEDDAAGPSSAQKSKGWKLLPKTPKVSKPKQNGLADDDVMGDNDLDLPGLEEASKLVPTSPAGAAIGAPSPARPASAKKAGEESNGGEKKRKKLVRPPPTASVDPMRDLPLMLLVRCPAERVDFRKGAIECISYILENCDTSRGRITNHLIGFLPDFLQCHVKERRNIGNNLVATVLGKMVGISTLGDDEDEDGGPRAGPSRLHSLPGSPAFSPQKQIGKTPARGPGINKNRGVALAIGGGHPRARTKDEPRTTPTRKLPEREIEKLMAQLLERTSDAAPSVRNTAMQGVGLAMLASQSFHKAVVPPDNKRCFVEGSMTPPFVGTKTPPEGSYTPPVDKFGIPLDSAVIGNSSLSPEPLDGSVEDDIDAMGDSMVDTDNEDTPRVLDVDLPGLGGETATPVGDVGLDQSDIDSDADSEPGML